MQVRSYLSTLLLTAIGSALLLSAVVGTVLWRKEKALRSSGQASEDYLLVHGLTNQSSELLLALDLVTMDSSALSVMVERMAGQYMEIIEALEESGSLVPREDVGEVKGSFERVMRQAEVAFVALENTDEKRDHLNRLDTLIQKHIGALERLRTNASRLAREQVDILKAKQRHTFVWIGLAFVAYLTLMVLLRQWLTRRLVRPLNVLSSAAERAGKSGESFNLEPTGPAEIRTLTRAVSTFVGSLEDNIRRLSESERQFRTLVEHAPEAVAVYDVDAMRFVAVNKNVERLFKLDREQLLRSGPLELSPPVQPDGTESAKLAGKMLDRALKEETTEFEWLHRDSEGTEFLAEVRLVRLPYSSQRLLRASITDITERKKAEETMLHVAKGVSAQMGAGFFRSLVEHLGEALQADYAYICELIHDDAKRVRTLAGLADGKIVDNLEYDLAGTPCENVVDQKVCSYPSRVQTQFPRDAFLEEMRVEAYVGAPVFDSAGRPRGLITVLYRHSLNNPKPPEAMLQIFAVRAGVEIERVQAEQALRDSERRYRMLFESANDAIFLMNGDVFLDCNESVLRLLDCTREEFIGQTPYRFAPPRQADGLDSQERGAQKFKAALSGRAQFFEWRARRDDGTLLDVEVSLNRFDRAGKGLLLGVGRDRTARNKMDEKLRLYQQDLRSLASTLTVAEEGERRRIATHLHDGAAQDLACAMMKLREAQESTRTTALSRSLTEIHGLISRTADDLRSLSRDLSPPVLYEIGLEAALEALAERCEVVWGIPCEFEEDDRPKPLNPSVRALAYRSVCELLANVAKHAGTCRARLAIRRRENEVEVVVEDNGRGFDASLSSSGPKGHGGLGLVSIRERLHAVCGEMRIESEPEHGTKVVLTIPLLMTAVDEANLSESSTGT